MTDGNSGAPRLEGYEAAARLFGYQKSEIGWLVTTACLIHRLVQRQEHVDWITETGKPYRLVGYEDVR